MKKHKEIIEYERSMDVVNFILIQDEINQEKEQIMEEEDKQPWLTDPVEIIKEALKKSYNDYSTREERIYSLLKVAYMFGLRDCLVYYAVDILLSQVEIEMKQTSFETEADKLQEKSIMDSIYKMLDDANGYF